MLTKIKAVLTGGCAHEYVTTGENVINADNTKRKCTISTNVMCKKCGDKVLIELVPGLVIDKVSNKYVSKFKKDS